jgi:hypothetical protein
VRVPSEAGQGAARVTIRILDWKEQKLPPAVFAVPLDNSANKIQIAKPWKD